MFGKLLHIIFQLKTSFDGSVPHQTKSQIRKSKIIFPII